MAIRIRKIKSYTIALCAAETNLNKNDLYLDDNIHHALNTKFALDYESEGLLKNPPVDKILKRIMKTQVKRNAEKELNKYLQSIQKL